MNHRKTRIASYVLFSLAATIAIIAILINIMSGKTEATYGAAETYKSKLLSCKSTDIEYPFFSYDNSRRKELFIDAIFTDDTLDTISLKYNLYYNDQSEISKSQAINHASMDMSFYEHGLNANSFDVTYSALKDSMHTILYVTRDNFDQIAATYFMIEQSNANEIPGSIDDYAAIYRKGGFTCQIIE